MLVQGFVCRGGNSEAPPVDGDGLSGCFLEILGVNTPHGFNGLAVTLGDSGD